MPSFLLRGTVNAFAAALASAAARARGRVGALRSMLGTRHRPAPAHEHWCQYGHCFIHVDGDCDRTARRLCLYHKMNLRCSREYGIRLDEKGDQILHGQ